MNSGRFSQRLAFRNDRPNERELDGTVAIRVDDLKSEDPLKLESLDQPFSPEIRSELGPSEKLFLPNLWGEGSEYGRERASDARVSLYASF